MRKLCLGRAVSRPVRYQAAPVAVAAHRAVIRDRHCEHRSYIVRRTISFLAVIAGTATQAWSQTAVTSTSTSTTTSGAPSLQYYAPASLSGVLQAQFAALGNRLQQPGNERITMTGTLTDANGTASVRVIIQNGGNLNITFTGSASPPLIFNGTAASGVTPQATQDGLLQAFVDDLPDTLMTSAAKGAGLRLLGQRFTNASGAMCDIYDAPSLGQTVTTTSPITKRYCFDSRTFLLNFVEYGTNSGLAKTQFTWQQVNGQTVPATVTRTQGGTQTFSFQAQSALTSAAAAAPNVFSSQGN